MAMADNGRVVCKCTAARRSFFCFREISFDDKPNRRNHLRNVSAVPVFKNGIFTRCSPSVAGNSILSMDARENPRSSILPSSRDKRIPIYVMMPVDAFCIDGSGRPRIRKIKALTVALKALKLAGVHGIAVEIGDQNKHIYYRDQNGFSNDDYLTLGVDHVALFCGQTALQCYEDFLSSFAKKFESLIGTVIEEISVGLGPSGEFKWKFPGTGEFQCYGKYMMGDLKMAARKEGKPQWEEKGPQKAGCYNSLPSEVPFFGEGEESFLSDYGCFFPCMKAACLIVSQEKFLHS